MTVLELLVGIGGFVIVSGILLQIYDETRDASLKMTRRQAALDFSVAAVDEIRALLRDAVPPDSLDPPGRGRAEFRNDAMTFPAYVGDARAGGEDGAGGAVGGLAQVTLPLLANALEDGTPDGRMTYLRKTIPWDEIEAGGEGRRRTLGGLAFEGFRPRISFRYATRSTAAGPVSYENALPAGTWPALVEITVRVELPDSVGEVPIFRTSVIPGGVPDAGGAR